MKTLGVAICFTAFTACVDQPTPTFESDSVPLEIETIAQQPHAAVCNGGRVRCYAQQRTDETGRVKAFAQASGLGADDLASAYALDVSVDPSATIAIVDAYGYTNLASDLAQYRSQYSLPACTVANGCLKIVNQQGQTSPLPSNPPSNDDWTVETALDVDMASAGCPKCKILVVQADDDQGNGLDIANATAATLGATVVSNSWGGPEDSSVASQETYFNHPGIAVFVAAGDNGNTGTSPDYPSTSAYTIGVGGTTLTASGSARGWTESAWSAGGSSCSNNVAKPSWQTSSACTKRAASDVSAVGDPNTGVAVYNGGWQAVGGTSAASPLVAGIYALTKHGGATAQFAYLNTAAFYDVTTGKNGTCTTAMCKAAAGWDGPTGVGTPNGAMLAALSGGNGSGSGSGSGSGGGNGSGSGTGMGSDTGSGGGSTGSDTGSGGGATGGSDDNGAGTHGGCSVGGGTGSGALLFLALAFVRRRRRVSRG
ncbi:MAG: S53 family peptidase [Kofleriaceae bacterium]